MDEKIYSERREYHPYPESLKRAVVQEYLSTKASKTYLKRKYDISGITIINYWLKRYGRNDYLSPAKKVCVMPTKKTEETAEVEKLKHRIRQLERELEDAKFLSEAYSLMIRKAEEDLKIPIRKKYNTK
jgi:transposase-like protein